MVAWWTELLHPFAQDVGSVVPPVFEAYARVFHPVIDHDGRRLRWSDVAAANDRAVHREMQFHTISRPPGSPPAEAGSMDDRVSWGSLPTDELVVLVELLTAHTELLEPWWACVWEGYGGLALPPGGERVIVPGRSYRLVRTSSAGIVGLAGSLGGRSPNVWWPDDRAWLVATEVDHAWTYVGGSRACVEAVAADTRLEALAGRASDRFTWDADTGNV